MGMILSNHCIDFTFFSLVRGCWERYSWWQGGKTAFQTLHGINPVSSPTFMWWDTNPGGLCSNNSTLQVSAGAFFLFWVFSKSRTQEKKS